MTGKRIAFFGPEGSFTHLAALQYCSEANSFSGFSRISQAAELLEAGSADYCIVPAENSTGGMVVDTLDLLIRSKMKVVDEIRIPIIQNLLSKELELKKITRIYSHPQSLMQCSAFLNKELPNAQLVTALSNSAGARLAAEEGEGCAAIGSKILAGLYGLNLLCESINDRKENETRFFLLGRDASVEYGKHAVILFALQNQPGALCCILQIFQAYQCNMTQISSRPSQVKNWEYLFVIEFDTLSDAKRNSEMLDKIKCCCTYYNCAGMY